MFLLGSPVMRAALADEHCVMAAHVQPSDRGRGDIKEYGSRAMNSWKRINNLANGNPQFGQLFGSSTVTSQSEARKRRQYGGDTRTDSQSMEEGKD